MLRLKRMRIKAAAFIAAGLILILTAIVTGRTDTLVFTYGAALCAIGAAWVLRAVWLKADPKRLSQYERAQTDERIAFIASRSGHMTFVISIVGELIAAIILSLMGNEEVATVVSMVICAQSLCYVCIYYKYSR